jgi:hypothetical protein
MQPLANLPDVAAWMNRRIARYLDQRHAPEARFAPLPVPAMPHLSRAFALTTAEQALLWASAAGTLFNQVAAAYRPLHAGTEPKLGLLCELVSDAPEAAEALLHLLATERSNLLRFGLLSIEGDERWAQRRVRVAHDVLQSLTMGPEALPPAETLTPRPWPTAQQRALAILLRQPEAVRVIIGGPEAARAVAAVGPVEVLTLPLSRTSPTALRHLGRALRRARITQRQLIVQLEGHPASTVARVLQWARRHPQSVTVIVPDGSLVPAALGLPTIHAPKRSHETAIAQTSPNGLTAPAQTEGSAPPAWARQARSPHS